MKTRLNLGNTLAGESRFLGNLGASDLRRSLDMEPGRRGIFEKLESEKMGEKWCKLAKEVGTLASYL